MENNDYKWPYNNGKATAGTLFKSEWYKATVEELLNGVGGILLRETALH